jgi:hypothetical protein
MKTVIWRIHDWKPGHANQTQGLVNSLAAMVEALLIGCILSISAAVLREFFVGIE